MKLFVLVSLMLVACGSLSDEIGTNSSAYHDDSARVVIVISEGTPPYSEPAVQDGGPVVALDDLCTWDLYDAADGECDVRTQDN